MVAPALAAPPRGSRLLSAAEVALATSLVIGHNLLHALPNEVPLLVALGLIATRLRTGGFAALGLTRPSSWRRVAGLAVAAAAIRIAGGAVIEQATASFWPPVAAPAGVDAITGNLRQAGQWLLLVWTWAAFGEELGYRGYLVRTTGHLLGGRTAARWAGMVYVAFLFGVAHWYKGPAGVVDSAFAGLVLGAAYLATGGNLWASVLAHGLIDTVGVVALYLGWTS